MLDMILITIYLFNVCFNTRFVFFAEISPYCIHVFEIYTYVI